MSEEIAPLSPEEISRFNEILLGYLTRHDTSRLEELFNLFDRNRNGSLGADEIKITMEQISGHGFSDAQIQNMMRAADRNNDGSIDIREFINVMKHLTD